LRYCLLKHNGAGKDADGGTVAGRRLARACARATVGGPEPKRRPLGGLICICVKVAVSGANKFLQNLTGYSV
jgi:hypothetical protein